MVATSRLCGRGFQDKSTWWLKKTSPTAKRNSQHVCMHWSVQKGWRVYKRDAVRAFLQCKKLDRRVCMEPPPEAGEDPNYVWECISSVYGLGDAPRWWTDGVITAFQVEEARSMPGDRCTWMFLIRKEIFLNGKKVQRHKVWVWCSFHVGDFRYSAAAENMDSLEAILLKNFKMGDAEKDDFIFCASTSSIWSQSN